MNTQEVIAYLVQQIGNQIPQFPQTMNPNNWVLSKRGEVRPPHQTEFYQCMSDDGLEPLGVIAKIRLTGDRTQIVDIELFDVNQGLDSYRGFLEGMFGTNLDRLRKGNNPGDNNFMGFDDDEDEDF